MVDARQAARDYTREYGEDDPKVAEWRWIRETEPGLRSGQ
jgi:xylulose-5-phosphate/fructose-6-phosphate phosphoketolase